MEFPWASSIRWRAGGTLTGSMLDPKRRSLRSIRNGRGRGEREEKVEREEESARAQGHVITYPGTNYNMSSFLPEAGWTGRVARVVALTLPALPPPLPPTLPSILFHFLSSKSPPFSLPRLEGRILEN